MGDEAGTGSEIDKLSDDLRQRLSGVSGALGEVNQIADQLAYAVSGSFDFSVRVETEDPIVQKLSIMVNFFLETIRRTLKEIDEKNRKLLETERLKSEFVANVSHELRTPLTLALAPLESILAGECGPVPPDLTPLLKTMHNNSIRLLQMINGLLDFSRLEAGKLEVSREPTEIIALTQLILADFQPMLAKKGLTSSFTHDLSEAWISIDRNLYERILFNLLSNAVKFTPDGGRVSVSLRLAGGRLSLSVADTGIGIAAENLPQLFEKFRQIEGSTSRRFEGSGLGLALVKEFAALLKGTVEVDSEIDKGTTFTVTCQAPECAPADAPVSRAPMRFANAEFVEPARRSTAPRQDLPKVLIAEDNLELAAYISTLLHEHCWIQVAGDGDASLALAKQWLPDLILSDVMMPKRDGLSLCKEIKATPATMRTPVILVTALTHREALLQGWLAGADDYLFKPFHPTELVTRVRTMLSAVKARDEAEREIRELNEALQTKVKELGAANDSLRSLTGELQAARDQALEVSRFKSQFLANMSHEVRTPMNAIMGMLDLLNNSPLSKDQRDQVVTAHESAEALLSVINDILDFSKIEAGRLELEVSDFQILPLVEGVAELLADKAREKKLAFITFVSPSVPKMIRGDAGRVRQVLLNLVHNSLKFTDRGEVLVRVDLDNGGDTLKFSVTDTGIGLSAHALERLFQPFAQGDGSITRRYGGTGLGLSISSRLVELMGGQIGAEGSEGRGSTFWFSVPLERSTKPVPESRPKTDLTNVKLLVVDGPTSSAEVIHAYTASWGLRCYAAESGEQALALMSKAAAEEDPFDIAMLDALLPDMDAFTFAEAVKQRPHLAATKLIMLANVREEKQGEKAMQAGFSGYLTRPFRSSGLLDCLASVVCGDEQGIASRDVLTGEGIGRSPGSDDRSRGIVLVAEDNPANTKLLVLMLKRLGFDCQTVATGKEAVAVASRTRFKLILMDCQMPEMDGYEATRAIRKAEALTGRRTPIIAVTAHAIAGERDKCIAAGMDDYLSKPIKMEQLQTVLSCWSREDSPCERDCGSDAAHLKSPGGGLREEPVNLEELRRACGEAALPELIQVFVSGIPVLLDQLGASLERTDEKEFSLAAEHLAEACAGFKANEMARLGAHARQAAAARHWARASLLYNALRLSFERTSDLLRRAIS